VQKFAILTLAAMLAVTGCGKKKEAEITGTGAPAASSGNSDRFARLTEVIRSAPPKEASAACDEYAPSDLSPDLRERCATAHAELARELVDKDDAAGARQALDRARQEGAPAYRLTAVERSLKDAEERAALTAGIAKREAVAGDIASVFRYRGMDARVSTSGQYKQTITIVYPSFDYDLAETVKADSFVMGPIRDAGFKEVTVSDGNQFYSGWRVE
jgi:hypothetical protein